MATLNMEHVETECLICHENYIEPKILPCAHLLCRNCLVILVKTGTEAQCPLCRSATFDLKDGNLRRSEDLADSLPTDHSMSAIVESSKIISQRHVCFLHTNTDAVSLCLQCSVMMCQSCVDYHHAFPVTSLHKTENLATLTSELLAAFQQRPCSVHPNKIAKLFCPTHGVSICRLCASTKHRACHEMTDLNEITEKHKQSFEEMEDNLTKAESAMNETLTKYEDLVLWSEEDTKDAFTKIDSMCDDVIVSVESCRNKLKKILKDSEEGFKASVEDRKSYLARMIGLVTSHKLLLKRVQKTASSSVQVTMATMFQNRIKDLTSSVSLPLDMKTMEIVKLNIDEEAISRVKSELEKLSHMTVISPIRKSFLQNGWMFHDNCGSNLALDINRQTAEVKDKSIGSSRLVMSNEPMSTNNLYELKVEEIDTRYTGKYTLIGVCEERALLFPTSVNCYELKTFVGVQAFNDIRRCQTLKVEEIDTRYSGKYIVLGVCEESALSVPLPLQYYALKTFAGTDQYSCRALATIKAGSRLGVMVDASHSLHVYVDGKDQGVTAKNVAQPCYAVFDLRFFFRKVTTLPVSSPQ